MSKKTVIVTGVSGFIGSNLLAYLLKKKIDAIGYYRNYSNRIKALKINNRVIKVNSYLDIPEGNNYVIIHLAQNSNAKNTQVDRQRTKKSYELTQALVKKKFSHYVFVSSAAIYSDHNNFPINEKAINLSNSNYAKMKLRHENFFDNKKSTLLRITNVYGRYMNKGNIFDDIISQMPCNDVVKIKNPDVVREFLHIDDLCCAIFLICKKPIYGTYNVGSGKGLSIEELIRLIAKNYKSNSLKIISSEKEKKNSIIIVNSRKIMKKLNWKPIVKIEKGIKKLITTGEY